MLSFNDSMRTGKMIFESLLIRVTTNRIIFVKRSLKLVSRVYVVITFYTYLSDVDIIFEKVFEALSKSLLTIS